VDDPQYRARGTLTRVPDNELGGDLLFADVQPRLSATPGRIRHTGRPRGDANEQVFVQELGLTADELAALRDQGIV